MSKSISKKGGFIRFLIVTVVTVIMFIIVSGAIVVLFYLLTLPSLEELTPSPIAQTSKVYAIDGSLIAEFHAEENREIVPFEKMSPYIKDAIIAVEDKRFYEHQGVDYKRIIGALIADIRAGELVQGGSTITQQYVKNVYFSPEKTLRRKINEALIAIQLERHYTKDKILEMYLNTIYFGGGAYGIEKASQLYFGVHASELTLPQAALLAGLVRAPEEYSPFNDIEKAKNRRNLVLKLMYDQGYIDSKQLFEALASPVEVNTEQRGIGGTDSENRIAPYFIDYVKQQLYEKKFTSYDVFKGGLRIYTTLDPKLQKYAEDAIKTVFPEEIEPSYSLVSMDPSNGYIYALVGGKDYNKSKFNIATQGKRQPGSVFKVPVLIEAINQHISPNTKFNPNGPITIKVEGAPDWKVDNFGGEKFGEEMSVIDATIHSVNVVYAQLIMKVGPQNVEKLLNAMEIYDVGSNPAIGLGGLEKGVTPLNVTKIFATLAAGGFYHQPVCILKITDPEGNILYQYNPEENQANHRVIDEPIAYYVTQILKRVIKEGTGKRADIGRPAAGKTGTTSDFRDAWFAGYTPELATVVWMGHQDSSKPMKPINGRNIVGGAFPAEIWREFMKRALEDRPVSDFKKPQEELVDIEICTSSGLLPSFWCPEDSREYRIYVKGKEPKEICNIHNKIEIPNVIGINIEEARNIFESLYFDIDEVYEFNDDYEQDIVFDQEPKPGTIFEWLSTTEKPRITLRISKGQETFDMPDLIGLDVNTAEKVLKSYNMVIEKIVYDYDESQPIDTIFNQDPPANSRVTKSAKVTLYVSKGPNPQATVPNVVGLSEEEALSTLKAAGFVTITVVKEESKQPQDKVFSQVPESGTIYDRVSEIIIKISLGIKVPHVIGLERDEAVNKLVNLGFQVEILPDPNATGKVIDQIPKSDTYLEYGSKVTIELQQAKKQEGKEVLQKF
ncbi:MAG: PBP1A family penicillin-binding protein [Actinobacteria bacterium]|nr:PBP1A family penicillin-binding protein [Actinomycetota bacterium]